MLKDWKFAVSIVKRGTTSYNLKIQHRREHYNKQKSMIQYVYCLVVLDDDEFVVVVVFVVASVVVVYVESSCCSNNTTVLAITMTSFNIIIYCQKSLTWINIVTHSLK